MKRDWVRHAVALSCEKADFFHSSRKILRRQSLVFKYDGPDVELSDAGYTKTKGRLLEKLYFHAESIEVAKALWARRLDQNKYGSVGFHCYNHLIKNDPLKKSKRASVMGPCIQSVVLTYISSDHYDVDIFYRTTEFYKKFPADLWLIKQRLLADFDLDELKAINIHFANITIHPMYFVTLVPHLRNPIETMDQIREADPYFYNWLVKWSARYISNDPRYARGVDKFAQAQRVKMDAEKRIEPTLLKKLGEYLVENHPGHRNEYVAPGDKDDDADI